LQAGAPKSLFMERRRPAALPVCGPFVGWKSRPFITLDVTRNWRYAYRVVVSYGDKRTREFAAGSWIKAFSGFERSARLKPDRLEAATSLQDLAALPGNRFEALKGYRKGRYSVRINDQWRICFEWPDGAPGPSNVEIADSY
jgi:proteic killer suppression protein